MTYGAYKQIATLRDALAAITSTPSNVEAFKNAIELAESREGDRFITGDEFVELVFTMRDELDAILGGPIGEIKRAVNTLKRISETDEYTLATILVTTQDHAQEIKSKIGFLLDEFTVVDADIN